MVRSLRSPGRSATNSPGRALGRARARSRSGPGGSRSGRRRWLSPATSAAMRRPPSSASAAAVRRQRLVERSASQPNRCACLTAARRMLSRASGSVASRPSASAQSSALVPVAPAARTARPRPPCAGRRPPPRPPAYRRPAPPARPARRTRCTTARQTTCGCGTSPPAPAARIGVTNRITSSTPSARASSACASGCSMPVPDGPPMTATTSRLPQRRVALEQPRGRPEQHIGRLQRLDPADEQQDDGVRAARPSGAPGRGPVTGAGTCPGPRRVRPPRPSRARRRTASISSLRLVVGVGDQPVRGLDHLLLADHARRRLGCVAVGQAGVLDPGHRVHGVHQRHPPAVARRASRPARTASSASGSRRTSRARGSPRRAARPGEGAQLAGQFVLGESLERPGRDVRTSHAGHQLDPGGQARTRRPGEDLDLDAPGRPAAWTVSTT